MATYVYSPDLDRMVDKQTGEPNGSFHQHRTFVEIAAMTELRDFADSCYCGFQHRRKCSRRRQVFCCAAAQVTEPAIRCAGNLPFLLQPVSSKGEREHSINRSLSTHRKCRRLAVVEYLRRESPAVESRMVYVCPMF